MIDLELIQEKIDYLIAVNENLFELKELFYNNKKKFEFQEVYEKTTPLVSICIATCNRKELLLNRAISSLLRQTYQNLEIVIVGDHCTDDTEQAIVELNDPRIIFYNLPERGPYPAPGRDRWCVAGSYAMNKALDLTTGDFIAHLDDDDEFTNQKIESLVKCALKEKLELIWHKFSYQSADGLWHNLGYEELDLGHVTTGSIFYHKYFKQIKWDPFAYRMKEPGDWNRIRKIKFMDPKMKFYDEIMLLHYREGSQPKFQLRYNERFQES